MSKTTKRFLFLAIIAIASISFKHVQAQPKYGPVSKPPAFKDSTKIIESLKATYKCESIEFENWGDSDTTDATLTVCLVNSPNVPKAAAEDSFDQLKAIAKQIKDAVKHPELYKTYYIIFVKREIEGELTMNSHAAGAEISVTNL